MSLLDDAHPDCAAAVDALVAELAAGSAEDRAILLNLREEDRVPESKRAAFQRALSIGTGDKPAETARKAAQVARLALRVPVPLGRPEHGACASG